VAPKGLAVVEDVCLYIVEHNRLVEENGGVHPESGRPKLREILLSGGDPMVLSNKIIGNWWASLAEAGIENIRLGTKDLAFFPDRFDRAFLDMLDGFHRNYPTSVSICGSLNLPTRLEERRGGQLYANTTVVWPADSHCMRARTSQRYWVDNRQPVAIIRELRRCKALRILQANLT
jgi:hypothetical protein